MTKKQILRTAAAVLAAVAAVTAVVLAVLGSVTASADDSRTPINRVERGDNTVAITFDCAWDAPDTETLLSELSDAGAKATFFVTGEFCDAHPDSVRKMSAAGHSVQNLSDKNIHTSGMNVNDLIADTNQAAQKIKTLTGKAPEFYRAPYGDCDEKAITTLEGMGYFVIGCSTDSKDLEDPDPVSVTRRINDNIVSGSVLLFHNDSPAAAEALPGLLTGLKKRGYTFVTIDDLVYRSDYIVENGVQICRPSVSAALPVVYSDNRSLDSAFEKIRTNLSLQEIYDLSSVGRVALIDKIKELLNASELYAMREATYEELKECYLVLVYAAENYGCGGTYTEPEPVPVPTIMPPAGQDDAAPEEYADEPSYQQKDSARTADPAQKGEAAPDTGYSGTGTAEIK